MLKLLPYHDWHLLILREGIKKLFQHFVFIQISLKVSIPPPSYPNPLLMNFVACIQKKEGTSIFFNNYSNFVLSVFKWAIWSKGWTGPPAIPKHFGRHCGLLPLIELYNSWSVRITHVWYWCKISLNNIHFVTIL